MQVSAVNLVSNIIWYLHQACTDHRFHCTAYVFAAAQQDGTASENPVDLQRAGRRAFSRRVARGKDLEGEGGVSEERTGGLSQHAGSSWGRLILGVLLGVLVFSQVNPGKRR